MPSASLVTLPDIPNRPMRRTHRAKRRWIVVNETPPEGAMGEFWHEIREIKNDMQFTIAKVPAWFMSNERDAILIANAPLLLEAALLAIRSVRSGCDCIVNATTGARNGCGACRAHVALRYAIARARRKLSH